MNGIINVLKPSGMTSHDVVSFIRRKLSIKKVGHTGTLDPNAAGVLPICIGRATKVTQYITNDMKKYRCELTLGNETDTQDKYGVFVSHSYKNVTEEEIRSVFNRYIGNLEQIPPMYSAVKLNGKKLYELAREGKTVERKSRSVTVYDLDILKILDNKKIFFDVKCSKGTYIRTLCNDIGKELGTYGYMSFLLRTEVGDFTINESHTLEEIEEYIKNKNFENYLLPLDYPLMDYRRIDVNEFCYKKVINGVKVDLSLIIGSDQSCNANDILRVYYNGTFVGIGKVIKQMDTKILKMEKVMK